MFNKILAGLAALAVTSGAAMTDPVPLSATEIEDLLSGNTTVGIWSGTAYRQYYYSNGLTTYLPAEGPVENGKWRANHATNMYESHWGRAGWSAYGIAKEGDVLFWVERDGTMQAFTVEPGNRLTR